MSIQVIKVLKEGHQVENHTCQDEDWVIELIGKESTETTWITRRICVICGRAEKLSETRVVETFDSVFNKFYQGEE